MEEIEKRDRLSGWHMLANHWILGQMFYSLMRVKTIFLVFMDNIWSQES